MAHTQTFARFQAVQAALQKGADKPERWFAFLLPRRRPGSGFISLASSCLMGLDGHPDALARSLFDRHARLCDLVKRYNHPRAWVDGALSLRFGVDPDRYASLIEHNRFSHDGAMALTLLSNESVLPTNQTERVFKAIKPIFINGVTGLEGALWAYSAAHALRGERVETVQTLQARARSVFEADRSARRAAATGAYVCAGLGLDASAILKRFIPLYEDRKQYRAMNRLSREQLLLLAALGLSAEQAADFAEGIEATQRLPGLNNASRVMLTWLLWIQSNATQTALSEDQIRLAFIALTLSASVAVTAATHDGDGVGIGAGDGGGD